jgi:O-antigen ligase
MLLYLFLITLLPLTEHPVWSRYVGEMTIIKYLGAACLVYAIAHLGIRKSFPPYLGTNQSWWYLSFLLMNVVSYLTRSTPSAWEFNPILSYVSVFILGLITITLIDSLERLNWLLLAMVGSVAWGSLYVLREWQKYHAVLANFRPGYIVGDSNYFAISALISLPLAYQLAMRGGGHKDWQRYFCLACLAVTLVAFLLASSRGAFLGLLAALGVVVWRSRHRARNFALTFLMLLPLIVVPRSPVQRIVRPTAGDRVGTTDREASWKAGLRMIRAHPLGGIGLGNFKSQMPLYADRGTRAWTIAHNSYISVAAEVGLPALATYLGILFFTFRSISQSRRRAIRVRDETLYHSAIAAEAMLAGSVVGIFFLTAEMHRFVWLVIFVSMLLPALLDNQERQIRTRMRPQRALKADEREANLSLVTA